MRFDADGLPLHPPQRKLEGSLGRMPRRGVAPVYYWMPGRSMSTARDIGPYTE